ncbi:MAG: PAS/PAC sensor-containing diguanylate cyclase/phosphodiesterase [Comamonadaceae bacterium]|nr:MAG: PAS/PAC sensor-containing diguanylate cyclase/phosphodiesterase [Comamonadaceae bacterium]
MKTHLSFETKVLVAFAIAVLVVVSLAMTTWTIARGAADAADRVAHTHTVLDSLAQIKSDTLQIEFSTQSFRISGDTARLVERDATILTREAALQKITQLTIDNAQQQEHVRQLNEVISERIAISKRVEWLRKTEGMAAASAYVAVAPLKQTRERTYRLLREMEDEERELLKTQDAEQLHAHQTMVTAGALVAMLLLLLLAATYLLIRRQFRETEASRRALVNSEERLSTTLDSIGDGVLATDTQGRITRMNPVAEVLTGWPISQALGLHVEEVFCIIHEQTRERAVIPVMTVLATGTVQGLANHTLLIGKDGHEHPIADSAAPIRDSAGQLTGVVLVFRDVATERQAHKMIREQNELLEQRVHERTLQLQESEGHLRSVISNVPALIAYVDAQQHYVYANQQYQARFAPERSGIAGCTVSEILGPDRYAIASPLIAKVLQGEPQSYDWQPFPGVWQVINYLPKRDDQDRVMGYYVLGADITERKHAEAKITTLNAELEAHVRELEHVSRALRTLSAGNRAMLRAVNEEDLLASMCRAIVGAGGYGMAVVWYRRDDESSSLWPMAESGYSDGLAALRNLKVSWADHTHGRGAAANAIRTGQTTVVRDMLTDPNYAPWRAFLNGNASAIACPLRVGNEVIGALTIYHNEKNAFEPDEAELLTESADDLAFGIATLRARTEQQRTQEVMHHLSRHDVLTGLPNMTQFTELLTIAIEEGGQLNQPFAVLQTNIEQLSDINDTLGFSQGDQMLREFATRLGSVAPASASVARLRGNEFAILLRNSGAAEALDTLHHLSQQLLQPFQMTDISLDVTTKAGISLFPDHGETPHDLYRHVDIAIHLAKKKGRDYVIFDPARSQGQIHRLSMAGELRRAIEAGDLALYLQPKVEMATGRVCGAEGLVRWRHAERGLIMPGEFIGLAEHTGLIKPLTEWVMETSLRLNHTWERAGCALPIAVNLSARNLHDENLLEKVRQLQLAWGVSARLFELEITESTVMDDAEFSLRVLHGLRDAGIPLYIDDFGTGYSSLGYLQRLPVSYIKIDQSFVFGMLTSKESSVIVRSTIDLAHDLGQKVVAEGVETQEHWNQLAAFGCDIAQGYFLSRPMPAEDFQSWVKQFRAPVNLPPGDYCVIE